MLDLTMLYFVMVLIAGIASGYALRRRKKLDFSKVAFGIIMVLIFSLGFSMGSNGELLSSLPRVGLEAFVIMLLAVAFSVVFVKAAGKLVKLG
jgi:hypothetical protein